LFHVEVVEPLLVPQFSLFSLQVTVLAQHVLGHINIRRVRFVLAQNFGVLQIHLTFQVGISNLEFFQTGIILFLLKSSIFLDFLSHFQFDFLDPLPVEHIVFE